MEFSRQEYWSGLPFTSPGESSWPRDWIQVSASQADSLQSELQGSPMYHTNIWFSILMQIRKRYSPLADAASKVHGLTSTQCFIGRKSLCFLQVGTAYGKDIKPDPGLARCPLQVTFCGTGWSLTKCQPHRVLVLFLIMQTWVNHCPFLSTVRDLIWFMWQMSRLD